VHAVFIVVRAVSDLLDSAVRTLRTLTIPRVRLVLVRPAHRRGIVEALELLQAALPGYPLACEWEWNADRCVAARARREPIQRDAMGEELGLFGAGMIASRTARRRRWPLTRDGVQIR
jgi:hypothetical protein